MHSHGIATVTAPGDTWQDEFSHLDDRHDWALLPLPPISSSRRVVLVRHGQSTWNAEGRMQGSSDLSVLTDKGRRQAQATADFVSYLPSCAPRYFPAPAVLQYSVCAPSSISHLS